jgi:hypothetical protein
MILATSARQGHHRGQRAPWLTALPHPAEQRAFRAAALAFAAHEIGRQRGQSAADQLRTWAEGIG